MGERLAHCSHLREQIELTCAILQDPEHPLVRKPRLTEKCLERPPFRFLHDVISAVLKNTGFAPGLYQGAELEARLIQDKHAKAAYLTKIICVVSAVLGVPVPADPFKMVAGLEPENTNVFLQMLGKACSLGDAADIVQTMLYNERQAERLAMMPEDAQEPCLKKAEQLYDGLVCPGSASACQQWERSLEPGSCKEDCEVGCMGLSLSVSFGSPRAALRAILRRRSPAVHPCAV